MKINEINSLNEGIGSALIGAPAAAAIKGMFSGTGTKAQLAQDIFLKDFYGDAVTSLKNGISGGTVDKNLTMSAGNAPVGTDSETSVPSNVNPGAGIQQMSPRDLTTAKAQNKTAPGSASGTTPTKPMTPRERLMLQRQAKAVKEEATYDRLNSLFESIIEAEDEASTAKSIGEYMLEWFAVYMNGTNWESYRPKITELCRNIESSYRTGNWKGAIKTLAKAAFSIPGFTGAAGAKNVKPVSSQPAVAAQTQTDIDKNIQAMFAKNPTGVKKAVQNLNIK